MLWPSLAGSTNMSQDMSRGRLAQPGHAMSSLGQATGLDNTISTSMRGRG
jgi:hypothetical protein